MNARLRRHLPDGRTRLLGIVGDPLTHSLSPALHTAVLRRLDRNLIYIPVPVSAGRLGSFLRLAGELGFLGLNVTTPYKERVLRHARARDAETRRTRMANTLTFGRSGLPWAEGTDGAGILGWLESQGLGAEPFGVLGFGATARSLTHAAWRAGRSPSVVVTSRPGPVRRELTRWGGERGRDRLTGPPPAVAHVAMEGLDLLPWPRVWISTWPPDAGPLPSAIAGPGRAGRRVLLDMNYGEGRTTQAETARARGWWAADGLGPLLEQAARSLSLWLHEPVPAELFRAVAGIPRSGLGPIRRARTVRR